MPEFLDYLPEKDSALRGFLSSLSMGFGYDAYSTSSRFRNDDQILRNRASELLAHARGQLRERALQWKSLYLSCTPEHPVPSPERITQVKAMDQSIAQLEALDTKIRSAALPQDSAAWKMHRDSRAFLPQLLEADGLLLQSVSKLQSACSDPATPVSDFSAAVQEVESSWKHRQSVISGFFTI